MRYIFLLIIYNSVIFANINYEEGLKYFQAKEYMKSYVAFEKAFEVDVSNPKISFHIGRCFYEMRNYEQAMLAFQRVLILDESHLRSRLELARTYVKLEMNDRAKEELNRVLLSNLPRAVAKNIHMLIAHIHSKEKSIFWNYYFSISTGYDTNINANPGEDVLIGYLSSTFNVNPQNITADDEIAAMFTQEIFSASNVYAFDNSNLFLESSFFIFAQQYQHNSEFNLVYLSATETLGVIYNGYKITLPLNYSKIFYGAKALLDSYHIQIKVEKKITASSFARVALKYQNKNYQERSFEGRDVNVKEFEIAFNQIISSSMLRLSYIRLEEEKNNSLVSAFVNRDINTYTVDYLIALGAQVNLNLQYSYIEYKFDDIIPEDIKRVDEYSSYFASLSKQLSKSTSIALEYKFIDNSSNYIPVAYEKKIMTLKLSTSF